MKSFKKIKAFSSLGRKSNGDNAGSSQNGTSNGSMLPFFQPKAPTDVGSYNANQFGFRTLR